MEESPAKKWRNKNKDHIREYNKHYKQINREHVLKQAREYNHRKYIAKSKRSDKALTSSDKALTSSDKALEIPKKEELCAQPSFNIKFINGILVSF